MKKEPNDIIVRLLVRLAWMLRRNDKIFSLTKAALANPILSGALRSLTRAPQESGLSSQSSLLFLQSLQAGLQREAVVVIPVFNQAKSLELCLESVFRNTPKDIQIVIVDDASTEPDVQNLLNKYLETEMLIIMKNQFNLGFTKTVNKALRQYPNCDVILLNSDTIVSPLWYETLRFFAYTRENVASVTPSSNNAGPFSTVSDDVLLDNHRSEMLSEVAWQSRQTFAGLTIDVPTNHGFCTYLKRTALDAVGLFDESKYPRGYGEENDWSLRASQTGFTHLYAPSVFIYHQGSASFSIESHELKALASRQLRQDYPEYDILLTKFESKQFKKIKETLDNSPLSSSTFEGRNRVLMIQPISAGGAKYFADDLSDLLAQRFDIFNVELTETDEVKAFRRQEEVSLEIARWKIEQIGPAQLTSIENDSRLLDFCINNSIDFVIFNHLWNQSLKSVNGLLQLGIRSALVFHDYFAICPSHQLLDESFRNCEGRCTPGSSQCRVSLFAEAEIPPLKNNYVLRWRQRYSAFLDDFSSIIFPSEYSRRIFEDIYINNKAKRLVVPHFGSEAPISSNPESEIQSGTIKILIIGIITQEKGLDKVKALIECGRSNFEFHILGPSLGIKAANVIQHGPYERKELPKLISEISPHFSVMLSIWSETFSYVVSESWSSGVPIGVFNIGAQAERVSRVGGGLIFELECEPEFILDKIKQCVLDKNLYSQMQKNIENWRVDYGSEYYKAKVLQEWIEIMDMQALGPRAKP